MTRLEAAKAALAKAILEAPSASSQLPAPRITKTVVEVAKGDPNYRPENGGRVEVTVRRPRSASAPARRDVYEEMYWAAVRREFAPPVFAEVVHVYEPIKRFEEGY